jgi:hypothetical protein
VHGHQFDGGDAELLQVRDDGRVRHAGVRAALFLGDLRVQLGEALDVGLVDHRLVVGNPQVLVTVPVEERVNDHAHHHVAGRVLVVSGLRLAQVVREQRRIPVHLAVDGLGVRVQQELVGVEAVAGGRIIGAVDPVAVLLARLDLRDVAVPHVPVHFVQRDAGFLAVVGEEAQFHFFCSFAEQGKVGAGPIERGAKGISRSRPDFHNAPLCKTAAGEQERPYRWCELLPTVTAGCDYYVSGPQRY